MKHFDQASTIMSVSALLAKFDEFSAGCDPDFDNELEMLEREFAERRFTFGQ
jgi:hypothetical protein